MSNVYIQEPVTNGKVLLHTTVGDIDVELWSKECPKTCRNFVQHCIDGFYNNCDFHRVVAGFIVQTGDPERDGGRPAYNEELKDEFHSRLKFIRRGLVGMAKIDGRNGSQFFFTLGPTPELDQTNTLFAKVTGDTLFNMLKLGEGEVVDEIPDYVHRIISVEILANPFADMQPRLLNRHRPKEEIKKISSELKAVRNKKLLSFEDDSESEEFVSLKIKSAHDLGDDPRLLKEQILIEPVKQVCEEVLEEANHEEDDSADQKEEERERIRREFAEIFQELKRKDKQIEKNCLKRVAFGVDRNKPQKSDVEGKLTAEQRKKANEYNIQVKKVTAKRKFEKTPMSKKSHEKMILSRLEAFKERMKADTNSDLYNHTFCVEEDEGLVAGIVDANVENPERYHISDPRNPINKRRRGEAD